MSEQGYGAADTEHGIVSNESINYEPWLSRWWGLLVIGYVVLLCLFLLVMANETFGR